MDFKKLGEAASNTDSSVRQVVKGRVLQYDADFACYNVSDLDEPASKSFKKLLDLIEQKRILVGAETVNAHITLGTKSGREAVATKQEYQENRDPDKPIKVRVRELRHMLANMKPTETIKPTFNLHYEADDLICIMQNKHIDEFGLESSVIISGDKDLWMIKGWHADSTTGRMYLVDGYGKVEYRDVGNVDLKLVGEGTSWFWHQLIMGDRVDNIPGLQKISNTTLDKYFPLKSGKPRKQGAGACGEAKAVGILKGCTSDYEAVRRVYKAYVDYYGTEANEAIMEQAYLLWMQRSFNPFDVERFIQEECSAPMGFTPTQRDKINSFKDSIK